MEGYGVLGQNSFSKIVLGCREGLKDSLQRQKVDDNSHRSRTLVQNQKFAKTNVDHSLPASVYQASNIPN